MKSKKTIKIAGLIVLVVIALNLIAHYQKRSNEIAVSRVLLEQNRKYFLSKHFKGEKFTFKSTVALTSSKGKLTTRIQRNSLHTFNFVDMTVTQTLNVKGETKNAVYEINDYLKNRTPNSTVHILSINSAGLKEIRVKPDSQTIEYRYDNGKVCTFQGISREASVDLLQLN